MKPRLVLLFLLGLALPGCFKDFNVNTVLREPLRKVDVESARPVPVLPDQVQSDNAYQIADALWDEIDRESAKVQPSNRTEKK